MSHQVSTNLSSHPFELDGVYVDPVRRTVTVAGKVDSLQPRVMHVLTTLAASYPDYVDRDTLITTVWGTKHVTANALSNAISKLRHHLGDDTGVPRFVQTERSSGYRLLIEPRSLHRKGTDSKASGKTLFGDRRWLVWMIAALLAAIPAILLFLPKTGDQLTDLLIDNPGDWVIEVKTSSDEEAPEDGAAKEDSQ